MVVFTADKESRVALVTMRPYLANVAGTTKMVVSNKLGVLARSAYDENLTEP